MQKTNRSNTPNISIPKPITMADAINAARSEQFMNKFNPAVDQVVLKISNVVDGGLRFGSPWPLVGR